MTAIPPLIGSLGKDIFGRNTKPEYFRILMLVPGQLHDLG